MPNTLPESSHSQTHLQAFQFIQHAIDDRAGRGKGVSRPKGFIDSKCTGRSTHVIDANVYIQAGLIFIGSNGLLIPIEAYFNLIGVAPTDILRFTDIIPYWAKAASLKRETAVAKYEFFRLGRNNLLCRLEQKLWCLRKSSVRGVGVWTPGK